MCSSLVKISLSLSKLPMTWKCLVLYSLVTRDLAVPALTLYVFRIP